MSAPDKITDYGPGGSGVEYVRIDHYRRAVSALAEWEIIYQTVPSKFARARRGPAHRGSMKALEAARALLPGDRMLAHLDAEVAKLEEDNA